MGDDKIQELLLQLVQDMSFLKAKLSNIEEQKLSSRIDNLEAQNREHERTIRSLEKRNDSMEEFIRNNMNDSRKQQISVFISIGLAVFSAVLSLIINLLYGEDKMAIKIQLIIDEYKEELAKLMNENILLRAQVKQLQNDLEEFKKLLQNMHIEI